MYTAELSNLLDERQTNEYVQRSKGLKLFHKKSSSNQDQKG